MSDETRQDGALIGAAVARLTFLYVLMMLAGLIPALGLIALIASPEQNPALFLTCGVLVPLVGSGVGMTGYAYRRGFRDGQAREAAGTT